MKRISFQKVASAGPCAGAVAQRATASGYTMLMRDLGRRATAANRRRACAGYLLLREVCL